VLLFQRLQALLGDLFGERFDAVAGYEQTALLELFESTRCLLGADVTRHESACERVDDLAEGGLDCGLQPLLVTLNAAPDRLADEPARLRVVRLVALMGTKAIGALRLRFHDLGLDVLTRTCLELRLVQPTLPE
jgi:hypothetical protein